MEVDTSPISCCFDQESQSMLKDYREKGLGPTSVAIADSLTGRGLAGSTVLELGCGLGALTLELVGRGAASAVGVDLSPKMVELARALAIEKGLSGSVSYEQGDAAVAKLARSDIVILDTVLCCYPDVDSLVDNSSSAAERYYAFTVPDDRRLATRFVRVFLPVQHLMNRRGGFRFFVHPTRRIRQRLESRGFRLISEKHTGWIWSAFLFAASGVS